MDCKLVKGNKEIEPEYFIEPRRQVERKKGDTIYDQFYCEQLRNKYHCTDTLKLTCTQKGSGNFKSWTINFGYREMPDHWWQGL